VKAWLMPAVIVAVLGTMLLTALLADLLAPYSPTAINLTDRLLPPLSPGHLLGTDALGRDILSRIIHGTRVSLAVAMVSILVGGSIGTALGVAAAYFGGRVDALIMRLADIVLGFPLIIFAILFASFRQCRYHPGLGHVGEIRAYCPRRIAELEREGVCCCSADSGGV